MADRHLIDDLRHAITTACNDDLSEPSSDKRKRHLERIYAMQRAVDALSPLTDAAVDVLAERRRQVSVEGWTVEHDDTHADGEMARAAAAYALNAGRLSDNATKHVDWWPWSLEFWKPRDRRRDLVKAASLILAEIERLDRMTERGRLAPRPALGETSEQV